MKLMLVGGLQLPELGCARFQERLFSIILRLDDRGFQSVDPFLSCL